MCREPILAQLSTLSLARDDIVASMLRNGRERTDPSEDCGWGRGIIQHPGAGQEIALVQATPCMQRRFDDDARPQARVARALLGPASSHWTPQ